MKTASNKKTSKGFTLIELLITITITAILATASSIAYFVMLADTNTNNATQSISSIVKQSQDDAMNNTGGISTYGVYFTQNTVTLFPGSAYSSANTTNKVYYLPFGLSITNLSPVDNNPIVFSAQNGMLQNSGISFTLGNSFSSKVININQNGAIY
ncbi:MAG: prepilin-type N-terminal cleavage/methylation domain-containing protein [Patescibacteria group bacterium]